MKIFNLILMCVLLAIVNTACTTTGQTSTVVVDDANQGNQNLISVSAPAQINTFKIDDFVSVVVENNTEHKVAITQQGISLLLKNGLTWVKIENSVDVRNRILEPNYNKDFSLTEIVIFPEIMTSDSVVEIRVTVTGIDQQTKKAYQGFVDLTLYR